MPAADSPSREHIGPCRIVARVGAGGMGEVFKAWNPRLEREVAINAITGETPTLHPNLGTIPVATQPIRGLSFANGQGFVTSLASARSDIWLLEGFEIPSRSFLRWFRR